MRQFWFFVKHCVTFSKYFSKFGYGICFDKLFGFWKTWKLELLLMCQWTISLEGQPAMTFIDKPPLPLLLLRRGLTTEKIYLHPRINAVMKKFIFITVVEPGKLWLWKWYILKSKPSLKFGGNIIPDYRVSKKVR